MVASTENAAPIAVRFPEVPCDIDTIWGFSRGVDPHSDELSFEQPAGVLKFCKFLCGAVQLFLTVLVQCEHCRFLIAF